MHFSKVQVQGLIFKFIGVREEWTKGPGTGFNQFSVFGIVDSSRTAANGQHFFLTFYIFAVVMAVDSSFLAKDFFWSKILSTFLFSFFEGPSTGFNFAHSSVYARNGQRVQVQGLINFWFVGLSIPRV